MNARPWFITALMAVLFFAFISSAQAATPPCEPADVGGKGTRLIGASDPAIGKWAVYFCEVDRYTFVEVFAYVRAEDEKPLSWQAVVDALSSPKEWKLALTKHFSADHCKRRGETWFWTPEYKAICLKVAETVAAHRPRWTVVPNPAAADRSRPVYRVTNGVRGKTAVDGVRAQANARCWCNEIAVTDGTSTYCGADDIDEPLPKLQTLVTLCSKVTP